MVRARLKLGEGYGCVTPHAVRAHVDLLETAITVDSTTLLTLHISQSQALFTPLLLLLCMGYICRKGGGGERGEGKGGHLGWKQG